MAHRGVAHLEVQGVPHEGEPPQFREPAAWQPLHAAAPTYWAVVKAAAVCRQVAPRLVVPPHEKAVALAAVVLGVGLPPWAVPEAAERRAAARHEEGRRGAARRGLAPLLHPVAEAVAPALPQLEVASAEAALAGVGPWATPACCKAQ